MPLEKNTVRSVENFSTGIRGSRSAEYFLKKGYPVIFFNRSTSIKPFAIELHDINKWAASFTPYGSNTTFTDSVKLYHRFNNQSSPYSKLFLKIEFNTVQEYLRDLEEISKAINGLNLPSITYLAAAVSDFYVPDDQISEHKI